MLIYRSIPLPIPYHLDYYSFISKAIPLMLFFSNMLCLFILLNFHINFKIIFSVSTKNPFGIFIKIVLNLYINLEKIDIFTMLSLPIQERCMSLYLFRSSLISLITIFVYKETQTLTKSLTHMFLIIAMVMALLLLCRFQG